jgi:FKBP-type peptidyl-prolyl cis-trans isomerase SlyD
MPTTQVSDEKKIMTIKQNKVVAFTYILKDEQGEELEQSTADDPMVYLHGHRNMMQGVEEALAGKQEGDSLSVTLPPERAYGLVKDNAGQRIPIKHLVTKHKKYKQGMAVKVNTQEGPKDVVIIKVGRFNVDVDTNHPLAGKTVTFDIDVLKVRDATSDEIAHGHTHGIDGAASH